MQRLYQRAITRGHRPGDRKGLGAPVGSIYQLVLSGCPWPVAFHTEQCPLSSKSPIELVRRVIYINLTRSGQKFFLASKHILKKIKKYCPQLDMDGVMNVWIMKPGNKSRGRGIVLLNKLEDVLAKMNPSSKSDTRYVVQKYIGNRTI